VPSSISIRLGREFGLSPYEIEGWPDGFVDAYLEATASPETKQHRHELEMSERAKKLWENANA
tara:strand:- start:1254 stop:1442 length:189 start_codon:yes stop_codon:yes gene_type:complete